MNRFLCSLWMAVSASAAEAVFTHGVAAGDLTPTSVILWTRVDRAAELIADVSTDSDFNPSHQGVIRVHGKATAGHDFTLKVDVGGLQPGTRYHYRFRHGQSLSEAGTFKTPPMRQAAAGARFTWISDTDGSFTPPLNQFETLDHARLENTDFFVYLGDTVYMDMNPPIATDLPSMRAKYKQVRDFGALRRLFASTSSYVTWDDHEIGDDFAGLTVNPELFHNGRQAFEEYMPVPAWSAQNGFYRTFRWGKDVELFMLDERSFRSSPATTACLGDAAPLLPAALRALLLLPASPPAGCVPALFDPSRTLLGANQKAQFLSALQQSDATWKIIVNQVPMAAFFVLPYDRWEGYAAEREQLLGTIRAAGLKNVAVISGDLHATVIVDARGLMDPASTVREFIVGPVSQLPLRQGLTQLFGAATANGVLNLATSVAMPQCFNPDAYSYGVAEVHPVTKALTVTFKDGDGAPICSSTLTAQ